MNQILPPRFVSRIIAIGIPLILLYSMGSIYVGIYHWEVLEKPIPSLRDYVVTTGTSKAHRDDRSIQVGNLAEQLSKSKKVLGSTSNDTSVNVSTKNSRNNLQQVQILRDAAARESSKILKTDVNKHAYPGQLNCEKFGGPPNILAQEMVYWKDIPYDATVISPLTHPIETQYLTFELDEGGWNNVRMAFETVVAIAIASGRTLVLPPKLKIWGVIDNDEIMGLEDFFPLHATGLKLITFQSFLEKEALSGSLIDQTTGKPSFPPENRTDWNGLLANYESVRDGHGRILYGWLRNVTKPWRCSPDYTIGAFPAARGPSGASNIRSMLHNILDKEKKTKINWSERVQSFSINATQVNASAEDRLREILADRKKVCVYDASYQKAKVVHVLGEQSSGYRMLVHFYAFVYIEDYNLDLHMKRFIRDQLRYKDELHCAAGRIVHQIRLNAKDNGSGSGSFDTFHIRRDDFKDYYNDVFITAEDIYRNNTSAVIQEKRTVYIATDEKDLSFFSPLKEHYNLLFLRDFMNEITDVIPNFYGLLDQIVAARGDVFVGTLYSTFSGYINRLRGYSSNSTDGSTLSYYLTPDSLKSYRSIMRTYTGVEPQYWIREFPVCWRDIDHGLQHTARSALLS